MDLLDVSVYQI